MRKYNIDKVANAIVLAIDLGVQHLGKTKLMKLLFFADKEHLKRYGRPIFYDNYIKQEMGPVPSITYNIISSYNKEQGDFKKDVEKFLKQVDIGEKPIGCNFPMMQFTKKKEFNPEVFSKSEIDVLKKVFIKFKQLTAGKISSLSHELPEYRNAFMNDSISYEDMAEDMADYVKFWEGESKAFKEALSES